MSRFGNDLGGSGPAGIIGSGFDIVGSDVGSAWIGEHGRGTIRNPWSPLRIDHRSTQCKPMKRSSL